MNKQLYFTWLLFVYSHGHAQLDLQCSGRDMHSVYLSNYSGEIYRIDSVDSNPTNPIYVTSTPGSSAGGISINANLDSAAGPQTMYFVETGQPYFFWNGTGWTNTNHTAGAFGAVNPGGTANFIFNLDGNGNSLYRYDGTANGTLFLSNLNTSSLNAFYDIATDNLGNFYIFYNVSQQIVVYNTAGIIIDTFATTGITNGGGGLAIVGNRLYAVTTNELFEGVKTGNTVNFASIKNIGFTAGDIAACPEAGNLLSVSDNLSHLGSSVYPNPFNSALNIFIDDDDNFEVIIYDLLSRKLLQQEFTRTIVINTEQLAKGIYLYEVRNKNGVMKKGKIVKPACR
ncbi:MAG TPA: T9SS type A sorting domain-containing protein [Bacteroidia bacterium]|nr:T9SS type A sorting domain-containing protein [Bacteroidia bacterium]